MPRRKTRPAAAQARLQPSTRALILAQAERLIALKGVFGFALKDIARPLHVQVPAIYKHYTSRDDVLIEVSKTFVELLSRQFDYAPQMLERPVDALRECIDRFVDFHVEHPAYVRLSLTDLATPAGGMEYINLAAGGGFGDNLRTGPLAPMHRRLRALIVAGHAQGEMRKVAAIDLYRLIKSILLIRLVFPDDKLLTGTARKGSVREVKDLLWDVTSRYLATPPLRARRA